jgi:hypothetical protein
MFDETKYIIEKAYYQSSPTKVVPLTATSPLL